MNLAIKEAISTVLGKKHIHSAVRFWRNVNSVVIGRSQYVMSEVNLKVYKKNGIKVARIFTGGWAVYHDLGDLNYVIYLRKDHSLISDDLLITV